MDEGFNALGDQFISVVSFWQCAAEPLGSLDDDHRRLVPSCFGNSENCFVNFGWGHGDKAHVQMARLTIDYACNRSAMAELGHGLCK